MNLLVGVALVLGVMILVHEWGHFIVARLFGVRVDVFSIGFGPRLFGWKRGATDYRVSALPVGGYVRMAGQDPSDIDSADRDWVRMRSTQQGKTAGALSDATHAASELRGAEQLQMTPRGPAADELMGKPRWQRALISFAGPAVNLIFPVVLLAVYFVAIGVPYPTYQDQPIEITAVPANSTAAAAGLQPGDRVTAVDGERNPNWEQAEKVLSKISPNSKLTIELERAGSRKTLEVPVEQKDMDQPEQLLGFAPVRPLMEDVVPGMPAQRAGLKEGDAIEAVDGQKIQWWGEFTERIRGSNGRPVTLDVDRHGQNVRLVVTPQQATNDRGESIYQIGVQVHQDIAHRRVSLAQGVTYASAKTWETTRETVGVVARLFSGRASLKQMYGPVGMSRAAGQAVQKGSLAIISLMVLISVNLGILNLLPIPILDGGHILLLAIEGGMRRDLSLAFKERFVQVGLVFLLVVFAIVMYNDVVRLLPIHS
jgi:regulator of sigma E protease